MPRQLEKTLKCLTCEEREDDQPEEFLKHTTIESSVDKHGVYIKGKIPSGKRIAYICPQCEDLVLLLRPKSTASGADRPESHPAGDDGQPCVA